MTPLDKALDDLCRAAQEWDAARDAYIACGSGDNVRPERLRAMAVYEGREHLALDAMLAYARAKKETTHD